MTHQSFGPIMLQPLRYLIQCLCIIYSLIGVRNEQNSAFSISFIKPVFR